MLTVSYQKSNHDAGSARVSYNGCIVKLFNATCPPKALVAKLKAAKRYPVKNCHAFVIGNAPPNCVHLFPSVLYQNVVVLCVLDPNAGVISACTLSQTSVVPSASVGPVAATVPVPEVPQFEFRVRPLTMTILEEVPSLWTPM